MLDDEKFDFSKETGIKDKLLDACIQKIKDKEQLRKTVTIDELSGTKKDITKIVNKSEGKTIKMNKEK